MQGRMQGTIVALVAMFAVTGEAAAQTPFQGDLGPAVDHCQAALPVYDTALRKRPAAIANEGDTPIFVTCGMAVSTYSSSNRTSVDLTFQHYLDVPVEVSCTLVVRTASGLQHYTRSRDILSGYFDSQQLSWDSKNDNGGAPFSSARMSCRLPPRVEITQMRVKG